MNNTTADAKIKETDKNLKMYQRIFGIALVVLVGIAAWSNVRVGFQIFSESETSNNYRKDLLRTGAALNVYIDSVDLKNVQLISLNKGIDSLDKLNIKKDVRIKILSNENKKLTDSIRNFRRYKSGSLEPVD